MLKVDRIDEQLNKNLVKSRERNMISLQDGMYGVDTSKTSNVL